MKTKTFLISALTVAFTACLALTACEPTETPDDGNGTETPGNGDERPGPGSGDSDLEIADLIGKWDQTWTYMYAEEDDPDAVDGVIIIDEAATERHFEFASGGTGYDEDNNSFSWTLSDGGQLLIYNTVEGRNLEYFVEELTSGKLVLSMTYEFEGDSETAAYYYHYKYTFTKANGGDGGTSVTTVTYKN